VIVWVLESEKVMFPPDVAAIANELCDWIGVLVLSREAEKCDPKKCEVIKMTTSFVHRQQGAK